MFVNISVNYYASMQINLISTALCHDSNENANK